MIPWYFCYIGYLSFLQYEILIVSIMWVLCFSYTASAMRFWLSLLRCLCYKIFITYIIKFWLALLFETLIAFAIWNLSSLCDIGVVFIKSTLAILLLNTSSFRRCIYSNSIAAMKYYYIKIAEVYNMNGWLPWM